LIDALETKMNAQPYNQESRELVWTSSLTRIAVLAVALRLIWAWWVPVIPVSDGAAYDAFARTLVLQGTFGWVENHPTAFWPPGTTFLHAALYALFGIRYEPIIAMNIALSVGVIWVTARLAARFWNQQTAVLTALVLAIWPTLVMYPTILASELPFAYFTLLALDLWTHPRLGATSRALLAGLVLGLAALIRPQALLLPLVYAAGLLLASRVTLTALLGQARCVALAGIVMAVVIAPWTWRNHQLYGEPVLISTNGGITLWMGNTPGTDGRYMVVPHHYSHLPENEKERVLKQEAINYIVQDPAAFAERAVRKLLILYTNESVGVGWNLPGIRQAFGDAWAHRLKRLTQVSWALICLLAAAGIWSSLRRSGIRNTLFSPISLSILYFTAIHMVVVSQERYHLAFAGQWAILAALGLGQLASWRQPRRTVNTSDPLY
jgi:4-amino-4-deoxy-L-arabinose transferase-like glycosyltransferase